ncbi:hypothetical protein [Actinokineospora globicatena]|uniref:Uncharacterized protein n=1 Tax=Actinokineospora globicatena TaxID=103729 RepID=A0A9W6QKS4_9PSEU|nr:hypothetical protein [Actinokineospora globicatena]MCP2301410.1 hypothetical protein [Actinokineospora globicatena]GLW76951.1 hypothetical protein Aglo01_14330 [Actinokineospora globicatena]GLW83784.1 hypothetical protein Aglo02_14240 [Actinokineospora globicatena]GLW92273.1 hypothetical protein Aglo03_30890 [Actinokineospora globicatena]
MDQPQYATATEVCRRLSGRLTDDVVSVVQSQFFAGEREMALSALLLNLQYEGVGITEDEAELIRALLDDPHDPELGEVAVVATPPAPSYRFSPTGPADAPDPSGADRVIAGEAAVAGGRRVRRVWRDPLPDAANPATWVYLVQVAPGADELRAHSAISSRLWVARQEKWPIEVVVEGRPLPPYQTAAVTAAHQVWAAA